MGGCESFKRAKEQQWNEQAKQHKKYQDKQPIKIAEKKKDLLQQKIDQIYEKYDYDQNGVLDRSQIRDMMKDMLKLKNRTFTQKQLQQFMQAADTDKDGLIQKNQLYNLYLKIETAPVIK